MSETLLSFMHFAVGFVYKSYHIYARASKGGAITPILQGRKLRSQCWEVGKPEFEPRISDIQVPLHRQLDRSLQRIDNQLSQKLLASYCLLPGLA